MFGGGALLAGFSKSFGFLIFAYGIILGLGMGLVYSCTIGNTVKFFPDKRGMVGGLTTATYGLGSVILAPIARMMVENMVLQALSGLEYRIPDRYLYGRIPDHPIVRQDLFRKVIRLLHRYRDRRVQRPDLVSHDGIQFFIYFSIMCSYAAHSSGLNEFPVFTSSTECQSAWTLRQRRRSYLFSRYATQAGRVLCGFNSDKPGRINTLA